jgi:hypothetical protein
MPFTYVHLPVADAMEWGSHKIKLFEIVAEKVFIQPDCVSLV